VQLLGVPCTVCSTRSETSRPVEHCEAAIVQRRIQETSRTVEVEGVPGCGHNSHFPLTAVRPAEYLLINQSNRTWTQLVVLVFISTYFEV
jgi:hypothetical protein